MKASDWEFKSRAILFGLIFGLPFALYSLDPENSVAVFSNWLGAKLQANPDLIARGLFFLAALLMALAALLRTWASAYLNASVVYAADIKSAHLVADGPYRNVRNPLYLANVLMAVAFGAMMSRSGLLLAIIAMIWFSYRLIYREESELAESQGQQYESYCRAVSRLWPAVRPRVPSSGRAANWSAGLQAEFWYWGLALAILAFAITFKLMWFFGVTTASVLFFWFSSSKPGRN